MSDIKLAALAAAGLVAVAPAAHAAASGTATLSNFHYQLVDLDPNDGIVPAVTFNSFPGYVGGAVVSAGWYPPGSTACNCEFASGAIGSALSIAPANGQTTAAATTYVGDPGGTGQGPSAWASVTTSQSDGGGQAGAYVIESRFTLTPQTLLVFYASTSGLSASSSTLGQTVDTFSGVQLSNETYDTTSSQYSSLYVDAKGNLYNSFLSTVSASFPNSTAAAATGYAYASAYVHISGIPEPGTCAMLLAGLLPLGLLARRRLMR